MIECISCGLGIDSPHIDGIWLDGEQVHCKDCEAVLQVAIDEDNGEAYVIAWWCVHNVQDIDPCDRCEADTQGVTHQPSSSDLA